jgi:hypothetical protein
VEHRRSFFHFFRHLPQGISTVHSFRTAAQRILIAERLQMREIAITASVNDTLPVIAKAGSAAVFLKPESEQAARLNLIKRRMDMLPSGSQT